MKARSLFCLAATVAFGCSALATVTTVEVWDWQDGRDYLILQANAMQWLHWEYQVPGVEAGHNDPTWITTTLDGATVLNNYEWFPEWPDGAGYGAYSSVFTGLDPILPGPELTGFSLEVLQARNAVNLIQAPDAGNAYTTVVEFDDNPPGGADYYGIRLTYEAVPEPASIVGLSALALMLVRRRRKA